MRRRSCPTHTTLEHTVTAQKTLDIDISLAHPTFQSPQVSLFHFLTLLPLDRPALSNCHIPSPSSSSPYLPVTHHRHIVTPPGPTSHCFFFSFSLQHAALDSSRRRSQRDSGRVGFQPSSKGATLSLPYHVDQTAHGKKKRTDFLRPLRIRLLFSFPSQHHVAHIIAPTACRPPQNPAPSCRHPQA
ncbi:hypothetical protein LZ30DRAFT_311745 [Colletotrichum cereale]|nr:hypothetical protein LZ30DRAFT_311745 [Colletotrichum cereale]